MSEVEILRPIFEKYNVVDCIQKVKEELDEINKINRKKQIYERLKERAKMDIHICLLLGLESGTDYILNDVYSEKLDECNSISDICIFMKTILWGDHWIDFSLRIIEKELDENIIILL